MAEGVKVADLFGALGFRIDERSVSAANNVIGFIKKGLVAIASMAAVRWAGGIIKETVDAADRLDELAQQTGVNVESLQALGHAASFSGLSVADLAQSLGFFGKNADAAARGSKLQAAAFRRVGIDAKAVVSGALSTEDALGLVAERFAAMPNGAAKSTLSMQIFGRSGKALIPFLNEGKAGLARLTQEARDLGVVMDGETIKSMAAFNDEQDKVSASFRGLKMQVVAAILPTLHKMVTGLRHWIKANRELIKSSLSTLLKGLVVAASAFAKVIGVVATVLKVLVDNIELVAIALTGLGIAMLILRAKSIAAAIASAAAWALSLLPFVLLGLLIAGVILIVQDLYSWFSGGDSVLKDLYASAVKWLTWDKLWEGIKIGIGGVLAGLGTIGQKINDALGIETGKTFLVGGGGQGGINQWTSDFQAPVNQARRRAELGFGVSGGMIGPAPMLAPSPSASAGPAVAGARSVSNVNHITVNGGTGDPAEIARKVKDAMDDLARITDAALAGGQ